MAGWSCTRRRAQPPTSASCWSSPTRCLWQRCTALRPRRTAELGCQCKLQDFQDPQIHYSQHSILQMQEWVDRIVADDKLWDQNAFNELMTRGMQLAPRREDRLFM
jgi:hypothetical protein